MDEKKGARKRLPSCLCSLFLFPFTAFLVVLVNPALPICAERGAAGGIVAVAGSALLDFNHDSTG